MRTSEIMYNCFMKFGGDCNSFYFFLENIYYLKLFAKKYFLVDLLYYLVQTLLSKPIFSFKLFIFS